MKTTLMEQTSANIMTSIRVTVATIVLCGGIYPLALYVFARLAAPESASGSLLRDPSGQVVGSRLIAQGFTEARYFWPRPSAVKYNGAGAGGSNLSPAGPEVRQRAVQSVADFSADHLRPLPADLATASGSGLDPFITRQAARYQASRVARARGVPLSVIEAAIQLEADGQALLPTGEGLVNVLSLNLKLDAGQQRMTEPRH
ncbi:MAG: potassium-transporting ATPase subunit C [Chlorobiaceae bacterium]|nr:potassium-transporting ATPase subunit C [Chlorobiaceae bacterium]